MSNARPQHDLMMRLLVIVIIWFSLPVLMYYLLDTTFPVLFQLSRVRIIVWIVIGYCLLSTWRIASEVNKIITVHNLGRIDKLLSRSSSFSKLIGLLSLAQIVGNRYGPIPGVFSRQFLPCYNAYRLWWEHNKNDIVWNPMLFIYMLPSENEFLLMQRREPYRGIGHGTGDASRTEPGTLHGSD